MRSSGIGRTLPLPLFAGEGWGGGAPASEFPVWREPPPAALFERVGLPRKRERRTEQADRLSRAHMRLPCRLRGEVGLHRRCNPGEGEPPRVRLSTERAEAAPHPDLLPVKNGEKEKKRAAPFRSDLHRCDHNGC